LESEKPERESREGRKRRVKTKNSTVMFKGRSCTPEGRGVPPKDEGVKQRQKGKFPHGAGRTSSNQGSPTAMTPEICGNTEHRGTENGGERKLLKNGHQNHKNEKIW